MIALLSLKSSSGLCQLKQGILLSAEQRQPIAHAHIYTLKASASTITNEEGFFQLQFTQPDDTIVINHIGYETLRYPAQVFFYALSDTIPMQAKAIRVGEVVVLAKDARSLVRKALQRMRYNYPQQSVHFAAYYRLSIMENQQYVYLAEALLDLQHLSYVRPRQTDGRLRLIHLKASTNKSQVFEHFSLYPGYIAQRSFDFHTQHFLRHPQHYQFELVGQMPYGSHMLYVIAFKPVRGATFSGRLYIDSHSMAFVRIEYTQRLDKEPSQLHHTNHAKAYRQRYTHQSSIVEFRPYANKWVLAYIREQTHSQVVFIHLDRSVELVGISELVPVGRTDDKQTQNKSNTLPLHTDISRLGSSTSEAMWEAFNPVAPHQALKQLSQPHH